MQSSRVLVAPVQDAPVVGSPSFATNEDTAITVTAADLLVGSTDVDGDILSVSGVALSNPAAGSLVDNLNGTWTFTPTANWNGGLSLDYSVGDGTTTTTASAALTVNAINDNPVAVADTALTSEDTGMTISASALLANDSDLDGDTLSLASVANAVNGTVALDVNGDVVFTPAANFNGTATFDYTATDGFGGTASSTVTVDVVAPASAVSSVLLTPEIGIGSWKLTGSGGGIYGLVYTIDASEGTPDANGWVTLTSGARVRVTDLATGVYEYDPVAHTGGDSFSFRATDTLGNSSVATVDVTVGTPGTGVLLPAATSGHDSFVSGADVDTISGLGGDDILVGGAGADALNGGVGRDTVLYWSSSAAVTVDLSTGLGSGGSALGDVLTGIEIVQGSAFGDTLSGSTLSDNLQGMNGNDTLFGDAGNDQLYGQAGDDALDGGAGNDMLSGGEGNDTLRGGLGADHMDGGSGDDIYQISRGDGQDIINNIGEGGFCRQSVFHGRGLVNPVRIWWSTPSAPRIRCLSRIGM